VRACQIDRHFFSLNPAHSLSFFNRSFDCIDCGIRIYNHSLSQSTRFSLADADDIQQSTFAWRTSNTRHPAGPYVETDCVLRTLGHLQELLT
jgi:hypothetical protein